MLARSMVLSTCVGEGPSRHRRMALKIGKLLVWGVQGRGFVVSTTGTLQFKNTFDPGKARQALYAYSHSVPPLT